MDWWRTRPCCGRRREARQRLWRSCGSFTTRLYGLYCRDFSGDVPVLHHMRELWNYFSRSFRETDTLLRQVRKAGDCRAYETAVRQFFYDAELYH